MRYLVNPIIEIGIYVIRKNSRSCINNDREKIFYKKR